MQLKIHSMLFVNEDFKLLSYSFQVLGRLLFIAEGSNFLVNLNVHIK